MERSMQDGGNNYGTSIGVEFIAIKDQLEIEISTTYLGSNHPRQLSQEILFKIPFDLTPSLEFDLGVGPQFGRLFDNQNGASNQIGASFAAELMYWPTKKFGYYINPEFGFGLGSSSGERSFGLSVGVLVGW